MLKTEVLDGVATITINRPERLNALNWPTMDAICEAVRDLGQRPETRVLVITGEGRAFSAGADLTDVGAVGDLKASIADGMQNTINPMCEALMASPVPTMVAVNGACAGGGVGLALLADVTVATRSAYFLIPQVTTLGLVPDIGATWALPRLAGRARAMGMSLFGDRIPAEQAEQWGLIWRCFDDEAFSDGMAGLAGRLATLNPESVVATRRLVDAASTTTVAEAVVAERAEQVPLLGNPVFAARLAAFAS